MLPGFARLASQHQRAPGLEQQLFTLPLARQFHDAGGAERDPHDDIRENRGVDVRTNALPRTVFGDDRLIGQVRIRQSRLIRTPISLAQPGRSPTRYDPPFA